MRLFVSLTLAVTLIAAAPSWAAGAATGDCEARLRAMPAATLIADQQLRALYQYDLKRAKDDLDEDDQSECTKALDHAMSLQPKGAAVKKKPAQPPRS